MIDFNNQEPLTFEENIEREQQLYKRLKLSSNVSAKTLHIKDIVKRKPERLRDKTFNIPQAIFLIEKEGFPIIIGRKIISDLFLENKINAPHCSQITASMLLGFLGQKQSSDTNIIIDYFPFTKGEKLTVFNSIKSDRLANIFFPFQYLDAISKKEKQCPPTGWTLNPQKVQNLANGETHFRNYTTQYFQGIIKTGDIVYDPACSTGEFLYSVKNNFPGCKTIGQDLSHDMTEYAQKNVDEIYTGDAINSPLPDESVDLMFLRFLNSEIVSTHRAYQLFTSLLPKVKPEGYVVLFGHTPILLKKDQLFEKNNLKLIHVNGFTPNQNSIFQYYILTKFNRPLG